MSDYLNAEQVLAAVEPPIGDFEMPGGRVGIRHLPVEEVLEIREWKTGDIEWLMRYSARVMCDDRGRRLYSDERAGELTKLGYATMYRLVCRSQALNLLTEEARETVRKNSVPAAN